MLNKIEGSYPHLPRSKGAPSALPCSGATIIIMVIIVKGTYSRVQKGDTVHFSFLLKLTITVNAFDN